jgi:hypothetical protein
MRVLKSRLGWVLVLLYIAGFIWAYFDAMSRKGTFLYDLWLDILALPYIVLVGRLFLQDPNFALHAHEPWGWGPRWHSVAACCWSSGPELRRP